MNIYQIIKEHIDSKKVGVLATVISRTGSAPRDVGARMFVAGDGSSYGTVGGGVLELQVQAEAMRVQGKNVSSIFHVRMDAKTVEAEGMICGGNVDVLIEPVTGSQGEVYGRLAEMNKKGRKGVVVTGLGREVFTKTLIEDNLFIAGDPIDEVLAEKYLRLLDDERIVVSDEGKFIVEPVVPRIQLYIFGAGHVSQYIARMAKMVNFYVVVIDDREEFANPDRFPDADEILVSNFTGAFSSISFTGSEFIVIVTRGHSHDADVLRAALSEKTRYVGMIGSKRKVKIIFDAMREYGFGDDAISRVHAPIGLPINAETPQEIAVSIVSQLIQIRRG